MEPDQELVQADSQHAFIYWEGGEHVAVAISAQLAHDALGRTVPTSLKISSSDTVTLVVDHHAASSSGDSFVYPIVAGAGWEGGYQGYVAEMPPPEPLPLPPGAEYWESSQLWVGAPEPIPSGEATVSTVGWSKKPYVKVICGHYSLRRPNEAFTGEYCGNPFKDDIGDGVIWHAAMRGVFRYKPGVAAKQNGTRACDQRSYERSLTARYFVDPAYECDYGVRTSDGNGGEEVPVGHYLRALAHWTLRSKPLCAGAVCSPPGPEHQEDKELEVHLWPSGNADRTVP
jgi:hypothetical protein